MHVVEVHTCMHVQCIEEIWERLEATDLDDYLWSLNYRSGSFSFYSLSVFFDASRDGVLRKVVFIPFQLLSLQKSGSAKDNSTPMQVLMTSSKPDLLPKLSLKELQTQDLATGATGPSYYPASQLCLGFHHHLA